MDLRNENKNKKEELETRFLLARTRILEIADGQDTQMSEALKDYFVRTARYLVMCADLYQSIAQGERGSLTLEELERENRNFFRDILPENYESSFANPAYAVRTLGEEFGRILSFLYSEFWQIRAACFEQNLKRITILFELFLEVHFLFEGQIRYRQVREHIYSFLYDNAEEWVGHRVREMLDPSLDFALSVIKDSDLDDLRYLYRYGEYISEDEIQMARHLSGLDDSVIEDIARNICQGYRRGFELKSVDLSKKKTVNIRFPIGFERVVRECIRQFGEMGLSPTIYRNAQSTLNKRMNIRIGYAGSCVNEQFEYDHRFDQALYFDKRMSDRKLSCMRKAFENNIDYTQDYAGPAYIELFGRIPFVPESKEEACRLSNRQQSLQTEYSTLSSQLTNEYIDQEECSFTMVAYPCPTIGNQFAEIFEEIRKVNTLDNQKYSEIQQAMIDVLDTAEHVRIMGRGRNMTNLTIALCPLSDPDKETKFENCLADVNIPVGEVFTSPKLKGTSGLLHVQEVFLDGLQFKDLRLTFEDGRIVDYSCGNYDDPEEGRKYIEDNIFYGQSGLPMGEFAIGTNTVAYVMASRYGIMDKLPILIAEKMGPHIAVGDTCYSYSEEVKVYNPDGKEVIARENEISKLRETDPAHAYFHCHTDITIPYEELDRITCVTAQRVEIPIILDGRFALEGTFSLNEPFVNGRRNI